MSNPYYNHGSSQPLTGSPGSSSTMRAEFDAITAAFNLLPVFGAGTAGYVAIVAPSGTTMLASNYLSFDGSGNGTFLNNLAVAGAVLSAPSATANFLNLAVSGSISFGSGTISGALNFLTSPTGPDPTAGTQQFATAHFVQTVAFSAALPTINASTAGMMVSNNGSVGAWVPPIANDWILQQQGMI